MKFSLLIIVIYLFPANHTLYAAYGHKDKKSKENAPDFTLDVSAPATPVKDQYHSNTCWSFATLSFLESELINRKHKAYNLSEMFVIRKTYIEKAKRYIRMHGNINFAGGGEANDVINVIKKYGIMPEEAYSGLISDSFRYNQFRMDAELKIFVNNIVKNPAKNLKPNWEKEFEAIIDRYMGPLPETFAYEGIKYTAKSFADSLNLPLDNYVLVTSFNHHAYYKPFILEIPDNWSWGKVYNVPLDDLVTITNNVLRKKSSVVWATDDSEAGFDFSAGMAVAPKMLYEADGKKEKSKIDRMPENEKLKKFYDLNYPVNEITVTQQMRQKAFDNYSTTDDHGMHIVGIATGKDGKEYYYVKNSWGTGNKYGGYLYVSDAYFEYKTISIMVDKTLIPDDLREKLNL